MMRTSGALFNLLRLPNLRAQIGIARDYRSQVRLHFLYAAHQSGLLAALRTPASREQVRQALHVVRPDLLDVLLELGVALRELRHADGRYALRGARARALASAQGDPLVALVQGDVTYYASAYRHLAARLQGASLGQYVADNGPTIARASRLGEPLVAAFLRSVVRPHGALRVLDVGCGSGIYVRQAAQLNRESTGVGIDLDAQVVAQATTNLEAWGLGRRYTARVADARRLPADLGGPFDLVTLFNNIYYFAFDERVALFRALRAQLAPGGILAIVSFTHGTSVGTLNLDVLLRSSEGTTALPELATLVRHVRESGFAGVTTRRLLPGESFYGLVATAAAVRNARRVRST